MMNEPTLYRIDLSPTYGKTPETQRPIYKQSDVDEWIADGVLVPVGPDYEAGIAKAGTVMQELDNFEAAIVAGIRAALGIGSDDAK